MLDDVAGHIVCRCAGREFIRLQLDLLRTHRPTNDVWVYFVTPFSHFIFFLTYILYIYCIYLSTAYTAYTVYTIYCTLYILHIYHVCIQYIIYQYKRIRVSAIKNLNPNPKVIQHRTEPVHKFCRWWIHWRACPGRP